MAGALGPTVVEIRWVANPFRGDKFEATWAPIAELALDFGASGYAFFRNKEDQALFTQLAFFREGLDFDRYWHSERVADARAQASGLYQVPVVPNWQKVVGFGSRSLSPVET